MGLPLFACIPTGFPFLLVVKREAYRLVYPENCLHFQDFWHTVESKCTQKNFYSLTNLLTILKK